MEKADGVRGIHGWTLPHAIGRGERLGLLVAGCWFLVFIPRTRTKIDKPMKTMNWIVIPAKAGTHGLRAVHLQQLEQRPWVPAFAGMTI